MHLAKVLPILLLAAHCLRAADANAPADFTISTTVAAPAPERYGVNLVHQTEINARALGNGFEPTTLRIKGTATGGGANFILNDAGQTTSYYSTIGDGFFDGATVRVYRVTNGTLGLVRTDTVASYVTDGFRRVNAVPITDTSFTDTGLTPGATYRYVIYAIDKSANNSNVSAEVSAVPASGTTATPTPHFYSGSYYHGDSTRPAAPSGVTAAAAPGAVVLAWTANADTDLAGYWVYRKTIADTDRNKIFLATTDAAHPVQAGDLYFIDHSSLEPPFDKENPRLPLNEVWTLRCGNAWPYAQPATKTHELYDPGDPSPKPDNAGYSCLKISSSASGQECTIRQNGFTTPTGYYQPLTPGRTYRAEMWLKQQGIANGAVRFYCTNDYSAVSKTWNGVDGTWRRYTYDFVAPAYPDATHAVSEIVLSFNAPGTLWVDNFVIYDPAQPAFAFLADSTQALLDFQPGSLRIRCAETDGKLGTYLEDITNPDVMTRNQWGTLQGGDTYFDYNCTLPTALPLCHQIGAAPWLVIGPCFSENEWRGLIEYLAAPYDPVANPTTDTPALKPWAAKRYAQRGTTRTWADEFSKIRIEFGNEMWNSPSFDPWTFNGTLSGQVAEYFFKQAKLSPYWSVVSGKIDFMLNGQLPSSSTSGYGPSAKQQSPSASLVNFASYLGGWDAGIVLGGGAFTDAGLSDFMMYGPTAIRAAVDQQAATRDTLNAQGFAYDLVNYESGPGYSLPSPQVLYDPVEELYGKSLAAGVATLDAFLYGSIKRINPQVFFCLNHYFNWSSHSLRANGYNPHTAWLALQMVNRYAGGSMLASYINSAPTMDVHSWTSTGGTTSPATPNTPLVVPYAMRSGNQYSVFVISRKITGDTPVTLRLPFTSISSGTAYALTGDPRVNNEGAQNVSIAQQPITNFTPTYQFTLPPGSAYLFVFNDANTANASNPTCTIAKGVGQSDPTTGAVAFTVTFSQPVTGFTASDVVLSGTAGATTVSVAETEPYLGTRYLVTITGMTQSGTVTIGVPANAATATSSGLGNLASSAIADTITFAFTDQLVAYEDFNLAPSAAPNAPFLHALATGAGFGAAWQIAGFNAATYGDGYKLAAATPLLFSNLRTTGNYAVGGKDFGVATRTLDVAGALGLWRIAGSNPAVVGGNGTVLWISALMRKDTADNNRLLLFFCNGTNLSLGGSVLAFGFCGDFPSTTVVGGTRYWSMQVRNAANNNFDVVRTNVPVVTGQAVLLVLKVSFGSVDRFDLFVNPSSLGGAAPATPNATWTTTGATDINFHTAGYSGGTTGSNQSAADELRFGNSFAAVTPTLSPVESWRQQRFGTWQNSGLAADAADPDGDGETNAYEYAFGGNPTQSDGPHRPQCGTVAVLGEARLTLSFSADPANTDVSYVVEASTNSIGPTWTPLASKTGLSPWTTTPGVSLQQSGNVVTLTDGVGLGTVGSRFLRVRAVR